jgi:class 3 adenylate cyclase/CheY-like chemotaxis protein
MTNLTARIRPSSEINFTVPEAEAHVLLVEDSRTQAMLMSRLLQAMGHRVTHVINGLLGLQVLRLGGVDVVISDIEMPVMDGFALLAAIHDDVELRHIPVLMVSVLEDLASIVRCLQLGAVDTLPKPCHEMILRVRLDACLERKRRHDKEQLLLTAIKHEKARADAVLLMVLPAAIAERLKAGEKTIADFYADTTVAFADIADFTHMAAGMSAVDLVEFLNRVFSAFDQVTERLGLEKIKTIGDAYLVMAGAPLARMDHTEAMAELALLLHQTAAKFPRPDGSPLRLRIGIHSGSVAAGVIGTSKFLYDVWGDTVNIASRLQTHAEPGMTLVSEATAIRLRGRFVLQDMGRADLKGVGLMRVSQLDGWRALPE